MRLLRCYRMIVLVGLTCAAWFGPAGGGAASAQTLEIQEEIAVLLEERDPFGIGYLKWLWRSAKVLNTEVDTNAFQGPLTLKEALSIVYEQFAARNVELVMLVDREAFRKAGVAEDVYDLGVDLTRLPKRVTLSRFLMEVLDQMPCDDATIIVRRTYLEITTVRAAGRQGLSFHVARRIAPVVRFWHFAGLVIALAYVALRGPGVWRRPQGKIIGLVSLLVRGGLVYLFWPVWLLVAGIGLMRRRVAGGAGKVAVSQPR